MKKFKKIWNGVVGFFKSTYEGIVSVDTCMNHNCNNYSGSGEFFCSSCKKEYAKRRRINEMKQAMKEFELENNEKN